MEQKKYICECGKEFDSSQQINAHKSNCKVHLSNKYTETELHEFFIHRYENMRAAQRAQSVEQSYQNELNKQEALQKWIEEKHFCAKCGKVMTEYYGSGVYCSKSCASSREHTQSTKDKISKSMQDFCRANIEEIKQLRKQEWKNRKQKKYQKYQDSLVSLHTKNGTVTLDITKKELEEYRENHLVCEICGREEVAITSNSDKPNKLCIDHDHTTNHFRGLLCNSCNAKLGWYEHQQANIEKYLQKE